MQLIKARIFVHRVPVAQPVRTSFGTMHDRPSVLLCVEDATGAAGWGEVWCNYPAVGAEHRARLLASVVLPLAARLAGEVPDAAALWAAMDARLRVLAIQTGEAGPLNQCLAGLECALHDLAARRAGVPLWQYLAPDAADGTPRVPVYASGINPGGAAETAAEARARGYGGCKIKIGFGHDLDRANLEGARARLGAEVPLMADSNQGWTLDAALAFAPVCDAVGLAWLEEPLRHDAPDADWQRLGARMTTPLAAGENFTSDAEFADLPARHRLKVLQPDVGKWGGLGRALAVARGARARGLTFCPHWLGGGVGLLASLHLKAASGPATGYVEVDYNPNPLREAVARVALEGLAQGTVPLPPAPGIGEVEAAIHGFDEHCVWRETVTLG